MIIFKLSSINYDNATFAGGGYKSVLHIEEFSGTRISGRYTQAWVYLAGWCRETWVLVDRRDKAWF
jgi:hypothetical protein